MPEAEEGDKEKPMPAARTTPINMKVQPEMYELFREAKQRYGVKDMQEAQLEIIKELQRQQGAPGPIGPSTQQIDAQKRMVESAQQTDALVAYADPFDEIMHMRKRRMAMRMMDEYEYGGSARQQGGPGPGMDMQQILNTGMIKSQQNQDQLNTIMMMKFLGGEGQGKGDDELRRILDEMEKNRRESNDMLAKVLDSMRSGRVDEERRAAEDREKAQSDRLMTFMNVMGENYQNFTMGALDKLRPAAEGGKTDMQQVTEVFSGLAALSKTMRESGHMFGLAPVSVDKVVSEQDRTSADKIENYLKAIGGIVKEVRPLVEQALTAGKEGPPSTTAMAPPTPAPPGVSPETDMLAPGLSRADFERQMEGKLSGGQWFIYDENEYANMVATTGRTAEALPQVSRISTKVGLYIILSEDQLQFLNGLAEQYRQHLAAQQALAQQPVTAEQPAPGTREWVAPPAEEEAKPPEEPIEEAAEPAPSGTVPALPSVIPRDKDWSAIDSDSTMQAPVVPVVGLETDKPPEAPEPQVCEACKESKILTSPPYCQECWKIINAVMAAEEARGKDMTGAEVVEAKVEEMPPPEVPEEAVAEEPEEATIELPPNAEQVVEGPDGKPAVVLNPLACQYCGKNCKSRGGRSAHERSCPENPENKEANE